MVVWLTFACHLFLVQCFIVQEYKRPPSHKSHGHIKHLWTERPFGLLEMFILLHWGYTFIFLLDLSISSLRIHILKGHKSKLVYILLHWPHNRKNYSLLSHLKQFVAREQYIRQFRSINDVLQNMNKQNLKSCDQWLCLWRSAHPDIGTFKNFKSSSFKLTLWVITF